MEKWWSECPEGVLMRPKSLLLCLWNRFASPVVDFSAPSTAIMQLLDYYFLLQRLIFKWLALPCIKRDTICTLLPNLSPWLGELSMRFWRTHALYVQHESWHTIRCVNLERGSLKMLYVDFPLEVVTWTHVPKAGLNVASDQKFGLVHELWNDKLTSNYIIPDSTQTHSMLF